MTAYHTKGNFSGYKMMQKVGPKTSWYNCKKFTEFVNVDRLRRHTLSRGSTNFVCRSISHCTLYTYDLSLVEF